MQVSSQDLVEEIVTLLIGGTILTNVIIQKELLVMRDYIMQEQILQNISLHQIHTYKIRLQVISTKSFVYVA